MVKENTTPQQQLIKAMISLQAELTSVKKDQKGQSGNRIFTYANLESIWEALHPLLVKNGLLFSQAVISEDNATYLQSTLMHESGGEISSSVKIDFPGSEVKQFGASITYYRRYAIQAIFCIQCTDNNKDEGETDPEKSKELIKRNEEDMIISKSDLNMLGNLIGNNQDLKNMLAEIHKSFGYKSAASIQKKNLSRYIKAIEDYKNSL